MLLKTLHLIIDNIDIMDLTAWIKKALSRHPKIILGTDLMMTPLSGDAGFRRYYRLNSKPSLLVVVAPTNSGASENATHFSNLSHLLREWGISAPRVLAYDAVNNRMLVEDFGDRLFFNELNEHTADNLYRQALTTLVQLQQIPQDKAAVPNYDQSLLYDEMNLFCEWFVGKLLEYSLSSQEQQLITDTFTFLERQALAQPQVFVHRDYHSRNLLVLKNRSPAVIDFQDAVWGPVTYDCVSLLRDCYLYWPRERVRAWALNYAAMAMESGVMPKVPQDQFLQWFDTMGLQRHIKVLGIFARLWLRDNKSRYLNDLPLVLHYIIEVAGCYQQTQQFATWLSNSLMEKIEKQMWYQEGRATRRFTIKAQMTRASARTIDNNGEIQL